MPPQDSPGISGDVDVNLEMKILQNIPQMATNILFRSKLFSILFFCATTEPIPSLALAISSHQLLTLSMSGY